MKITGRVLGADGSPLAAGKVDVVAPRAAKLASIGEGAVKDGALSVESKNAPVWGLRIDGQPVIAVVVAVDGQAVDVGEIALASEPVRWPVFHAPDGLVFGTPRVGGRAAPLKAVAAAATTTSTTGIGTRGGLSFGTLLGSSAQQIGSVVASAQGVQLTNASITIKGVPTSTDDAIGIEFPTPELVAAGTGLSEVSFTVKPVGPPPTVTPAPAGPELPDLLGYTRDLAIRKLAALRLVAEVRDEVITDQTGVGRVVRQIPAAGKPVSTSHVVQIFIGKFSGA